MLNYSWRFVFWKGYNMEFYISTMQLFSFTNHFGQSFLKSLPLLARWWGIPSMMIANSPRAFMYMAIGLIQCDIFHCYGYCLTFLSSCSVLYVENNTKAWNFVPYQHTFNTCCSHYLRSFKQIETSFNVCVSKFVMWHEWISKVLRHALIFNISMIELVELIYASLC